MGIISWFRNRKKDKALASFVNELPNLLAKAYGKSKFYSPGQIHKIVREHKFDEEFLNYAMAIYLDKERFDEFKKEAVFECDYEVLRKEVANKFFAGDEKFTSADVKSYTKVGANKSDPSRYFGGGGSFDGR